METNDDTTLLDLDSMMSKSMDDVEEAAGFITPSAGVYYLAVPWCKAEKYNKKADPADADQSPKVNHRIKLAYQVVELLEKSDPKDEDTPKNGLFTEVFQFNEQGLGYFKAKANDILETTEGLTVGETIKAINESAFVGKCRVGIKKTPKKEGAGGTGTDYINVQVKVLEKAADIPFPEIAEKKVEA